MKKMFAAFLLSACAVPGAATVLTFNDVPVSYVGASFDYGGLNFASGNQ